MGKSLKYLALVALTLVAAIFITGAILSLVIDPNSFKDPITAQVKEATGRDLAIEGDIELSIFPWVGLHLGKTRLSQTPAFGQGDFAAIESVEIRAKLLSLFARRLEINTLRLQGLNVRLTRNAAGVGNWEDLTGGPARKSEAPTPEKPQSESGQPKPPKLRILSVGGVELRDARIRFEDRQTGKTIQLDHIALITDALKPGRSTDVELEFDLDLTEPKLTGRFQLTAELALPKTGKGVVTLNDTALDLETEGADFETANLALRAEAIRFDPQNATLDAPALNLKAEAKPPAKEAIHGELNADLRADLKAMNIALDKLSLTALDIKLQGKATVQAVGTAEQRIDGSVDIVPFDLRRVLRELGQTPPITADPKALSRIALRTNFQIQGNRLQLREMRGELDASRLQGEILIDSLQGPAVRFDLALNALDADRYLAPKTQPQPENKPATGDGNESAESAQPIALPLERLRAMDVDGALDVGEFKINNLQSRDMRLRFKAKAGVLALAPFQAKLYEGRIEASPRLDVRKDIPVLAVKSQLTGFQIQPFLTDLQGKPARLRGTTDLETDLTASGLTPEAMKATLNGTAQFKLANGAIKGFNLAHAVRQAKAAFKGQSAKSAPSIKETDFTALTGSARITDGVAENRDLSAKTPLLRIRGAGQADLRQDTVDYKLKGTVVGSAKGQGGKDLQDLAGLTIPIHIRGPFEKPEIGVDLDDLLKDLAAERAKEQLKAIERKAKEKVREKVEEKLQEQLGDRLKGLFGR